MVSERRALFNHGALIMTVIITAREASARLFGSHASSNRRNHSNCVWVAEGIRLDGLFVR